MHNTDYFKDKKITIVGIARSGLACANQLFELGAQVSLTDIKERGQLESRLKGLKTKKIRVELGAHSREYIRGQDLVVISPGVSDSSPAVKFAGEFGIPVVSEIEVASILCPATIIAVTGSCGKTTVTTLIGEVLAAEGKKVFVCGNIGVPFCQVVDKMKAGDFVSLEVSSFQLERIRSFKPKISLILNFTENHLDRYKNMQDYLLAKKRIFMNQGPEDFLILNQDDPALRELAGESAAKVVYFSKSEGFNPNQSAVLAVAEILRIKEDTCCKVFQDFGGVEHRMEYVDSVNNVKFINDSKATTVDSAIWALENINSPVILIAGGKHKGLDYGVIRDFARKKLKHVVLIGEAKSKIRQALGEEFSITECNTLEEAANASLELAEAGDCILLSPMCSSFDMFEDYQQRGRAFKEIVRGLKAKRG